ncbi:MAG: hypothetical protein Q4D62_13165 [Planctomycetia bacterium]|nr:hypothetical protein [Planctomycetia bacterium]
MRSWFLWILLLLLAGCQPFPSQKTAPYASYVPTERGAVVANPMTVSGGDPYVVWETVVDVIRLYFDRIENEYPCQRNGEVITEGLLKTYPQIGATLLEPWRRDTVNMEERRESTVQTMRRIASVRVRHVGNGYTIDVRVEKELEDLAKPSMAQLPSATFRLDTQLPPVDDPIAVQGYHRGWIPQGRDTALEQEILCQLQMRLGK